MEPVRQSEVSDIESLRHYLEYRRQGLTKLYHYTNLEVLLLILRSGKLLLNNVRNLNDSLEQKRVARESADGYYVASFTYTARENVHYWAVYGRGDHFSVRVRFSSDSFQEPGALRFTDEGGNSITPLEVKLNDMIYCNPPSRRNTGCMWKHNGKYFKLSAGEREMSEEFPGFWKYDVWEHEKETRLFVRAAENRERIFLDLTDRMVSTMAVRYSPWLPDDIRPDITRMLKSAIREEYGIEKSDGFCRKSEIYNQIKMNG
jgi:hypothetical protein